MLEKLKINDLNRCQKYMIPAMLTKKNITLIDGPKTGKTLGALIALVSLLRNTKEKVQFLTFHISIYIDRISSLDKFFILMNLTNY